MTTNATRALTNARAKTRHRQATESVARIQRPADGGAT
jgi:hypothetical protein